jgi:hypothetical protein
MQPNLFAVYAPPEAGLPFLSVLIHKRGTVEAVEFGTFAEALQHTQRVKSAVEMKDEAARIREELTTLGFLNVHAA